MGSLRSLTAFAKALNSSGRAPPLNWPSAGLQLSFWSDGRSAQPAEGQFSGGARPLLLSGLAKAVSERSEPAFAGAQTSGQALRPSVQTVWYEILGFVGFCGFWVFVIEMLQTIIRARYLGFYAP